MLFADAAVMPKVPTRRLHSGSHSIVRPVQLTLSPNPTSNAPTSAAPSAASSPRVAPTALPDLASRVAAHLESDDASHSAASIATQTFAADKLVTVINPDGPQHLFIPSDLSKDRRYQHKYKNIIFDLLPLGTSEKMCAVVRGRRVGVFPESYVLFYLIRPYNSCSNHPAKLIADSC